ncbi:MAG: D-alanine--D-alanine ligase family protein [Elusimicrobiota bacterium]
MVNYNKKVGILTGGESAEREVSLSTAEAVEEALKELDINYKIIEARYGKNNFIPKLFENNIDVVFIAMHGGLGESGAIQGLLDIVDMPYTGSGVSSSAVCMDKVISKHIYSNNRILTPDWQILESYKDLNLKLPVVIKPVIGGSTIGTTIVREQKMVKKAMDAAREAVKDYRYNTGREIMAEKYIPGKEITVGILNGRALPILEIASQTEFYDYKAKYQPGMSTHYPLKDIDDKLYDQIQKTAEKAFSLCKCQGMGRVDFRLDGEKYYLLEINSIPGMTETSLLPEAAELAGINFKTLILKILKSVETKYT